MAQNGWLFGAAVDYSVNIANATDDRVAVLARPHLTTLSGTPADFMVGGEFVFKVSGINSGDIKPYPFGTTLTVTPTLLRTPDEGGGPLVRLAVTTGRTSILDLLNTEDLTDSVIFDKLKVTSEAVLGIGQTLILSGLNQRETRTGRSGVPVLKSIPVVKYLFSTKSTLVSNTSVMVLLTPRDPAFVDQQNRKALDKFVARRRDLLAARNGTPEDMKAYREKYPEWNTIPPNRFASHFFLLENSELYRAVSGEDLRDSDFSLDLVDEVK